MTTNMPSVSSLSPPGSFRRKKICSTYPTSGMSGTARSSLKSTAGSKARLISLFAQEVGLARLDRVEQVEDVEHDRERDGGLRRGQDDREDREHLAVELHRAEAVEGHEVDVRGVQDHLDPHEDVDDVAAAQDRDQSERE